MANETFATTWREINIFPAKNVRRIASQARKTGSICAFIGPISVTHARSSIGARQPRSGASRAGSMSSFLKACNADVTQTRGRLRARREMVGHPLGATKARRGATRFLMQAMPWVATKMTLHVLA